MSIIGGQTVAFIDALGCSPVEIWQVFDLGVHIAGNTPVTQFLELRSMPRRAAPTRVGELVESTARNPTARTGVVVYHICS
jgi:hypothetical protein